MQYFLTKPSISHFDSDLGTDLAVYEVTFKQFKIPERDIIFYTINWIGLRKASKIVDQKSRFAL